MAFCAEFLGMIHPDKARGGEGRSFLFSLGVVISQGWYMKKKKKDQKKN